MYGDTALPYGGRPNARTTRYILESCKTPRGCILWVQMEVLSMGGIYMEKPEEIRELGEDRSGGSKQI